MLMLVSRTIIALNDDQGHDGIFFGMKLVCKKHNFSAITNSKKHISISHQMISLFYFIFLKYSLRIGWATLDIMYIYL